MTTILLVEDQFELRAIHTAYLQDHGYKVVTAENGDTGLELARALRPDVIVLDHALPGRNGVDIAQAVHSDPRLRAIPMIMMTAVPFGAIGLKAKAAGCVGFLSKPCLPSRLLREIQGIQSSGSAR